MAVLLDYFNIATCVISLASAIAAMTETQKDNNFVGQLQKLLDIVALNIGKAKQ